MWLFISCPLPHDRLIPGTISCHSSSHLGSACERVSGGRPSCSTGWWWFSKGRGVHPSDERVIHNHTLLLSEKSPKWGQILPILQKLEKHFTVREEDTEFVCCLKQGIWKATALVCRFKQHVEDNTVWEWIKKKMMAGQIITSGQATLHGNRWLHTFRAGERTGKKEGCGRRGK